MMDKAGYVSQCIKKFLHISLLSGASSDTFAGRRRRSCQGFPRFTHRDSPGKAACVRGALQREEGEQGDGVSAVTFGSPAPQPAQAHPAEGTSRWEQRYMRQKMLTRHGALSLSG